jgi:hypothetical protein
MDMKCCVSPCGYNRVWAENRYLRDGITGRGQWKVKMMALLGYVASMCGARSRYSISAGKQKARGH